MQMNMTLPGRNGTQSAIAQVVYQYALNREETRQVVRMRTPVVVGPTIKEVTFQQGQLAVKMNRAKLIEIIEQINSKTVKVRFDTKSGEITIAIDQLEELIQAVEEIPAATVDSQGTYRIIE